MDKIVIIFIICACLIGWISYLIYEYKIMTLSNGCIKRITFYKDRYNSLQNCVNDLISLIHKKFPESTIEYVSDGMGNESIEGEIKY